MWRRVVRVLLAVLGGLVLLIGIAFALLHTDWGRDKVRAIAVAQVGKLLNGSFEIARLEGNLLDAITLKGVVVRDKQGVEVLKVDSLTVDYRIMPLLDQHFHADLIAIDGLEADLRRLPDGRLAVADLMKPQPPSEGPPWSVTLAEVKVGRSAVKFEREPKVVDELRRIEISAGLQMQPDATRISLPSLEAEYANQNLALAIHGDVALPKDAGVVATGVEVWAGRNHVMIPHATWGPKARNASLIAEVSAVELAKLWPDSKLLADVRLAGFVTQDPASERLSGNLFGSAGSGKLSLVGELDKDATGGNVALFWSGLEPHTIWTGLPEGHLDGWVAGEVAGLAHSSPLAVDALTGQLRGSLGGQLNGVSVSSVALDAEVARRRVSGNVVARARFGSAKVELAALLPAELGDTSAIVLELATVKANVRDVADLSEAIGQPPSAHGPLSLSASAKGPLDDLQVSARVDSKALTQKQLRLTGLHAELGVSHFDPARVPGPATGKAEVRVASIASGPTSYGGARVSATLSKGGRRADLTFAAGGGRAGFGARGALAARLGDDSVRIDFRQLRIATRKLLWQGRGGHFEMADGGRKLSGDLGLSSAAGSVRVSAKLLRRGDELVGPVKWQIAKVDLAKLLPQLGITGVRGRIATRGEIKLPSGPGRIEADALDVAWPGAPEPIDSKVRVTLAHRKLAAHADIDAGPIGKLAADVAARIPAVLTDGEAWKRLRVTAVQSVTVQSDRVDLARLARAGSEAGARAEQGRAEAAKAAGQKADKAADKKVAKAPDKAADKKVARAPDKNAKKAKKADKADKAGGKVPAADAGKVASEPPLRSGLAQLKLEMGPGLESGRVHLAVKGAELVAGPGGVIPLTAAVDAELRRAEVKITAKVDAAKRGKFDLEAAVAVPGQPFDGAAWSRQGLDLLRSARVVVTDFKLDGLDEMGGKPKDGRPLGLSGAVQAELTAGPGARALTAKVGFRDVRAAMLAAPLAGEFTATGKGKSTDLALAVRVKSGPLLEGSLNVGLGADDVRGFDFAGLGKKVQTTALRGQLRIPNQPVVRLATTLDEAPAVSGQLSGELTVGGTVSRPVLAVRVEAPGFTAQGVRFDRLQLRANYQAGPWRADVDARQADGGRVLLRATGGRDKRAPLQIHLSIGQLRLGLLTPLWKRPGGMLTYLQGTMQAELDVSGTPEQPVIDGRLQISQGEVRLASFLRPITGATVDVQFRRSQVQATVRGNSRPGSLRVDATADLRRLAQARFNVQLTTDKLPITAGTQLLRLDGKITASGYQRDSMLDIEIALERGLTVRLPSQKAEQLHSTGELDDVRFTDAAGIAAEEAKEEVKRAAGPQMRVRINSKGPVAVRSSDDSIRLDVRIKLTSTKVGALNSIDGAVEAVRGWVDVLGQRYDIERGWIRFGGEMPPNPALDIRVSHRFPETVVYIDVGGRATKPLVSFASDGGEYSQDQLLGMVLSGDSPSGGAEEGGGDTQKQATGAAAGLVANQVAGVIRKAGLPVDVLRFRSDPGAEDDSSAPNVVTVGKWLTDRLFVAFSYRNTTDSTKNQGEGQFQHFFTRDWMWEGVVGTRQNSIDLLWIVPLKR